MPKAETPPRTPTAGPLCGVRVVELAGIGPGPFAAMLLADLGADVVRVDRPGGPGLGIDPAHDVTNRNKRSVVVDLKAPDGPARVLDLAERADVLIEGYRPGVAERLGVGPGSCHSRNPRLVYGRMTGWGQDGPLAPRAGHDIGYIALTGALGMIGAPDTPPPAPANLLGDYAGGSLYLVVGILAALHHARGTGTGQVVDAAVVDGTAHLSSMIHGMLAAGGWQDRRGANLLDGGCPFYGTYETADGRYMAVGALEPRFYAEFTRLLGIPDPAPAARDDPARWPGLREAVAARFRSRTRDEWTAVFADSDACTAPVLSLREAPHHPHLAARGTFTDHGGLTQPAPAPRFSATPTSVRTGPALPGADTEAVARDWDLPGDRDPSPAPLPDSAPHNPQRPDPAPHNPQ
ncbi:MULTISPECIES: CaiB/BaiF CoA transferase family protein [Streptomyces]|uniref:CaiB/BaiF CoA transferase family protein n=1 Tax=Streptomyces TaxID=1883 RepID=UPI00056375FA|nr:MULTISPECIES: CaiB/BaiF CoA-transferase family protein [Streptomyces]MBZ6114603.1 CoA transferase [Streptomyces olivaceus]MBZ6128522.1 CoA transferase [Streptomyces olivaceus]MBZ6149308.1 CoA transferase [Streptomyces olivaceus]MBZ6163237.1 CoA transferase [Streptomyces olivaceus]MBZ6191041.1 CoA transferase [Streptomyces olivaceus]